MKAQDVGDLSADRVDRVQCRGGFLKHQADATTSDTAQVLRLHTQGITPFKENFSADDPARRGNEIKDRKGDDRLTAARLPYKGDDLSLLDVEGNVVDGAQFAFVEKERTGQISDRQNHDSQDLLHERLGIQGIAQAVRQQTERD